jgi:hypothetical protein
MRCSEPGESVVVAIHASRAPGRAELGSLGKMKKARNVLLAYVDGFDVQEIAPALEVRFREFAAGRKWCAQEIAVINELHPPYPEDEPDDLPPWNLGLNFTLPDKRESRDDWREDVRATVEFLVQLRSEFGRKFVVAVHDRERGVNEDVASVRSSRPDFQVIYSMIDAHRL